MGMIALPSPPPSTLADLPVIFAAKLRSMSDVVFVSIRAEVLQRLDTNGFVGTVGTPVSWNSRPIRCPGTSRGWPFRTETRTRNTMNTNMMIGNKKADVTLPKIFLLFSQNIALLNDPLILDTASGWSHPWKRISSHSTKFRAFQSRRNYSQWLKIRLKSLIDYD